MPHNIGSDLFNRIQECQQQLSVIDRQQRIDMRFGDHHNVRFPERAGVVVGEDVVGFEHFFDPGLAAEDLFAVEIFRLCHRERIVSVSFKK